MIIIDRPWKKLQVKLGGAVTTRELEWTISYTEDYKPAARDGLTQGVTPVLLVGGTPGTTQSADKGKKLVQYITVFNSDTVTQDVYIVFYNNTDTRTEIKVSLAVEYTLHYNEKGWYVTDTTGSTTTIIITMSAIAIGDTVTGGTPGFILYVDGSGNLANFAAITTNIAEGTNLYYTDARVLLAVLTGFVAGGAGPVTAAQIQSDWNQTNVSSLDYIKNKPTVPGVPTPSSGVSRTINGGGFQPSTTKVSNVKYSLSIAATLSLTAGQTGTVFLETSPNNSTWTEVDRFANGNTGTLTVGLNITQTMASNVSAWVPAGYYVRLRSTSTGSPTITYLSGQETTF